MRAFEKTPFSRPDVRHRRHTATGSFPLATPRMARGGFPSPFYRGLTAAPRAARGRERALTCCYLGGVPNENVRLRKVRVLLVDDDADRRELYAIALEQAGAEVRAVSDGDEALLALRTWVPSVVVSDLMLAGMDGFAMARRLRTMHAADRVPAIAVTGRSSP